MNENINRLCIGFSSCYQQDYNIGNLTDISVETAVDLVRKIIPADQIVGCGKGDTVSQLTEENAAGNHWLNKRFFIIAKSDNKWLSVYKHDGRFAIGISH